MPMRPYCDIGVTYLQFSDGSSRYQEPCRNQPTYRYRPSPEFPQKGWVEGHWNHRCANHVTWLDQSRLIVEALYQ